MLRSGSVPYVARMLYQRGGIPAEDMHSADAKDPSVMTSLLRKTRHLSDVEFTGLGGDVCIAHPFLLHRGSDNTVAMMPRMLVVSHCPLKRNMNITEGGSPVEDMVRDAVKGLLRHTCVI